MLLGTTMGYTPRHAFENRLSRFTDRAPKCPSLKGIRGLVEFLNARSARQDSRGHKLMNVPWFIFAMLLAMCAVLGIAFMTPQVPFEDVVTEDGGTERVIMSHGFEHPLFPTMERGGPGAERHEKTLWVGWAFAIICILFFISSLLLGAARHGELGPVKVPFAVGTAIFIAIFTALIFSYHGYMNEETHELFWSFPKPTAWMIFAVWPFPLFFMIVFYLQFDSWHFTKEDQRRLEEIVANRRKATTEEL